ncbi:tripartite tricarboxylate transporter TctB family protein [Roseomonas marmotae]|uniref:Tripartite tricarboxylate transporter TctB family protein n=1 Tax=Roseomonas marmotae TaxID=2768161 RepID=A0ABS3K868_9PROT|nr:tripartite tricarboxylate transporter TctB family protein [Roseomonas marmotae]MBO1073633.1 tripartite tricarboxylate transporter TctB family protein [Roseomonas marmotae]MBO1073663.1 tripartite tricarboxylate transporter TctB family protein [Roseomonas marmotae]QTI80189.1 tripartite tricarboxylate transporter TctB family protein [Roseomonas marmotae]
MRDYGDIIGGLLLMAAGAWFAMYSGNYSMGTLRRMGPGYFPVVIGGTIILFGLLVLVPGMLRAGSLPRPEWRPFATISLSVLAFAVIVERFGLVPATIALTLSAALAEPGLKPLRIILLALGLSALGVIVFTQGLGIPLPAFRWPQ